MIGEKKLQVEKFILIFKSKKKITINPPLVDLLIVKEIYNRFQEIWFSNGGKICNMENVQNKIG